MIIIPKTNSDNLLRKTLNYICKLGCLSVNRSNSERDVKSSLTHISLASHLWGIGKQCRPRSDTAERGVWSGSSLFASMNFYRK